MSALAGSRLGQAGSSYQMIPLLCCRLPAGLGCWPSAVSTWAAWSVTGVLSQIACRDHHICIAPVHLRRKSAIMSCRCMCLVCTLSITQ